MAKGESFRQGKSYRRIKYQYVSAISQKEHSRIYWTRRLEEYQAKAEQYPSFAGLVSLAEKKLKELNQ